MEKPCPALSPALDAKLTLIGAKLESGPSREAVREALDDLSLLPPSSIVRASREIQIAARLYEFRTGERFSIRKLLRRSLSERDLLEKNPDLAWLFLFHYSGYIREFALDAIATPPTSPFFIAAIAWRLNDWVEEVRQAAARCAARYLPSADPKLMAIAALYLLDRRFAWGRWHQGPFVLDSIFDREDVVAALAQLLEERSTGPLVTCLRHALRYPNIDGHLPTLAARAMQPAVRVVAYQSLLRGRAVWPIGFEWTWIDKIYGVRRWTPKLEERPLRSTPPAADLIRQGVLDWSPKVRSVAASALIEMREQVAGADELIGRLARDRSPKVRLRAEYMLSHPARASRQ